MYLLELSLYRREGDRRSWVTCARSPEELPCRAWESVPTWAFCPSTVGSAPVSKEEQGVAGNLALPVWSLVERWTYRVSFRKPLSRDA